MATPISIYLRASAKLAKRWRRRTIEGYGQASSNVLRTVANPKSAWSTRKRKAAQAALTSNGLFILLYIYIILVLLPTEFLRAHSTRNRTPMDLSHVQGLTYRCEGRISQHWWQSNEYSIGESTKFVSPCINIPQCHFVVFTASV